MWPQMAKIQVQQVRQQNHFGSAHSNFFDWSAQETNGFKPLIKDDGVWIILCQARTTEHVSQRVGENTS